MSDDADFDPNADVPIWVNILVPILSALTFIAVLVLLFHSKKEVPIETIEDWVEKIPLVNRCISTECDSLDAGHRSNNASTEDASTKDNHDNRKRSQVNERTNIRQSRSFNDIRRYDSISTIKSQDKTMSSVDLNRSSKKSYFYASQGTLISFESNV